MKLAEDSRGRAGRWHERRSRPDTIPASRLERATDRVSMARSTPRAFRLRHGLDVLAQRTVDVGGQRAVVGFRKLLKLRLNVWFKPDRYRIQLFLSFHHSRCSRL